jgi:1,4-dihydroxy-2-naphthoate octaprenyltransferase
MALGIYLTVQCGIVVLLLGMLCFAVGIFYTFGPAPISRTPYGEAASGLVMGYLIPFLAIFIGAPRGSLLEINLAALPLVSISMNALEVIFVLLVSTPLALTIANIMLANNICDVEKDVSINRYTLPYHMGNKNALRLFAGLYYMAFAVIGLVSIMGIVPIWGILGLFALIPVSRNIRVFEQRQVKSETFTLSVMNFLLINAGFALLIGVGAVVAGLLL